MKKKILLSLMFGSALFATQNYNNCAFQLAKSCIDVRNHRNYRDNVYRDYVKQLSSIAGSYMQPFDRGRVMDTNSDFLYSYVADNNSGDIMVNRKYPIAFFLISAGDYFIINELYDQIKRHDRQNLARMFVMENNAQNNGMEENNFVNIFSFVPENDEPLKVFDLLCQVYKDIYEQDENGVKKYDYAYRQIAQLLRTKDYNHMTPVDYVRKMVSDTQDKIRNRLNDMIGFLDRGELQLNVFKDLVSRKFELERVMAKMNMFLNNNERDLRTNNTIDCITNLFKYRLLKELEFSVHNMDTKTNIQHMDIETNIQRYKDLTSYERVLSQMEESHIANLICDLLESGIDTDYYDENGLSIYDYIKLSKNQALLDRFERKYGQNNVDHTNNQDLCEYLRDYYSDKRHTEMCGSKIASNIASILNAVSSSLRANEYIDNDMAMRSLKKYNYNLDSIYDIYNQIEGIGASYENYYQYNLNNPLRNLIFLNNTF